MMRLRYVATVGPAARGFGASAIGDDVSFLPLDRIWADERFDPSEVIEYTGRAGSYNPVNEGDILLPKVSPTFAHGRCTVARGLVGSRALATSEVFVIRAHDPRNAAFLTYGLRDPAFLEEGQASWTGVAGLKRVSARFVSDMRISSEAWRERHKIVGILDEVCARVAQCGRLARQVAARVEQARSAMLAEVLAGKGRNRTMWQTRSLASVVEMRPGRPIPSVAIREQDQYPVYGGNGIRGFTDACTHRGRHLLVGRQGALCGNVHDANGAFWASEHAVVVTAGSATNIDWLKALLEAMNLNQYSETAAQPGLTVERLRRLKILLPPLAEQAELVRDVPPIDVVDRAGSDLERMLSSLTAYRDSLIHEAVTGKIDVTRVSDAQMDERLHAAVEGRLDEVRI